MSAGALAFLAATAGSLAVCLLVSGSGAHGQGSRLISSASGLIDSVVALGRDGRDPGVLQRRRLLLSGAGIAGLTGLVLAGPVAGIALGAGGPWLVSRGLRARREHYRRGVEEESAAMALALADALAAGHSLRGALGEAASGVPGPAGHELARVVAELDAGARTEAALEAMRLRVKSERLDMVVAACLIQRRVGGDLAGLLREVAETFADQARLADEVRSATAQARFTGIVVVFLPLGGALLAELAQPGFVGGLLGSFLTAWLVGLAVALQAGAMFAIRHLGKVRW